MEEKNKSHWVAWLIVIAIIVVVGMWISGYNYAKKMVDDGSLSILTLSLTVKNMNAIKKSGYMYYVEHRTDYYKRLKELTTL